MGGLSLADALALCELFVGVSDPLCRHDRKGASCLRRPKPSWWVAPAGRGASPEGEPWIKVKNRDLWRYEMGRESAFNKPRVKQFV